MSSGMRAGFHFPPHNHSLLPGKDAAINLVGDTLPRQFHKWDRFSVACWLRVSPAKNLGKA